MYKLNEMSAKLGAVDPLGAPHLISFYYYVCEPKAIPGSQIHTSPPFMGVETKAARQGRH